MDTSQKAHIITAHAELLYVAGALPLFSSGNTYSKASCRPNKAQTHAFYIRERMLYTITRSLYHPALRGKDRGKTCSLEMHLWGLML